MAIHISIWTPHIGRSSSNPIPGRNKDADSVNTEHLDKNEDPGDADVERDGVEEQCCHKSKETWKSVYSHINMDATHW